MQKYDVEIPKYNIELQEYEIKNIIDALKKSHYTEISTNGKWEKMDGGVNYYYSETKKSRQLKFTINSMQRQLEILKSNNIV